MGTARRECGCKPACGYPWLLQLAGRPGLALTTMMMLLVLQGAQAAPLSPHFYAASCPKVASVVEGVVRQAVQKEARMAASLMRLHFHDCFVHGCDGSILMDDTATVKGEKTAFQSFNSLRGFDVVDNIKAAVEAVCKATVSCADILALTANASVALAGGPSWTVLLGRRDAKVPASPAVAEQALPLANTSMSTIISKFTAVGLSTQDTIVLSGGHSIGLARCITFINRLYNFSGTGRPDPTIDPRFLTTLRSICPQNGNLTVTTSLDSTATRFDNAYFRDQQRHRGVLQSDQELTSDRSTSGLTRTFALSQQAFFAAFAKSMVSMGNIRPLTGSQGEIRLNCRVANSY